MPRRILVLDDDPAVRHVYRALLEKAGYEISEATDGDSAIAVARRERFDLLLTDILHPGPGPAPVAAAACAAGPVPMLVVSGQAKSELEQAGASIWLAKPAENDRLLAAVRELIGDV
ncbi:MAG: response regulator [bacterium]